jgi:hypothetical protein
MEITTNKIILKSKVLRTPANEVRSHGIRVVSNFRNECL